MMVVVVHAELSEYHVFPLLFRRHQNAPTHIFIAIIQIWGGDPLADERGCFLPTAPNQ